MAEENLNLAVEENLSPPVDLAPPQNEHLREFVDTLAATYCEVERVQAGISVKNIMTRYDLPGRDLAQIESWLAEANRFFRDSSRTDLALTDASEWVLDNFYIIRQALAQIHEDLPIGFYEKLPKLSDNPLKGFPRVYAIARELLAYQHLLLNLMDLQAIMAQLQERVPLTIGEVWALPIFLRYCLVETLADVLVGFVRPLKTPSLPVESEIPSASGKPEAVVNAATVRRTAVKRKEGWKGSVANIILSLRAISEQDWNDFFEEVSRVELTLRTDPARVYPRMDFKTRDRYRKEIESLAFAVHMDENELAKTVISLAREGAHGGSRESQVVDLLAESTSSSENIDISLSGGDGFGPMIEDRRAHIGEYLYGEGRGALEKRIGYRPDASTALKRWSARHANILYLGSILSVDVILLVIYVLLAGMPAVHSIVPVPAGYRLVWWIAAGIISTAILVPSLTVATSLVNWLVTLIVPPRIFPKLSFKEGIPDPFHTMVVVPALLTGREEVDSLVRQLEQHYLRNPEPGLRFALLTDFTDADDETLPEDDGLVQRAVTAIQALNERYGSARPFYFIHRKRLWNPSEGKWMGWERKRGKLHELNLLLRGRSALSFSTLAGDMGKLLGASADSLLRSIRFVITLDADTVLPPGAANRLVGALAHPLNRAVFDERTGQVRRGYTVLQPRMEIHPKSTNYSWFTRIFAGDTGLDLYTLAVSNAYQDLFGEGSYVGKGIYDVDAFERSIEGRIPENTILSHDLLEGLMGRAGLVTDITMVEDYPSNYYVQVLRQRRWIRGDWQLLPWLFGRGRHETQLTAIDRWKIFDNLVRALLAPALITIFMSGVVFFPGLSGFWTAFVLLSLGVPLLTSLALSTLRSMRGDHLAPILQPLKWNLLRWLLALAFLPYEANTAYDAILTTLHRMWVSHRFLLQWTTSAQTTRMFHLRAYQRVVWLKLAASGALAILVIIGVQLVYAFWGPGLAPALIFAAPILLLWSMSPFIAQRINQPIASHSQPVSEEGVSLLRQVSRRTWAFFERYAGPDDHWLPPDNFQESPVGRIAHHTSPTNIGLLLTSTLAAYDFGYLDQLGLATRLTNTLDTLDQLQRYRNHFLNWYDTLTLQPLRPRYISTVDSGNLAACLIIAAQACKSLPAQPVFRWELWQGYLDSLTSLSETLAGLARARPAQLVDQQVEEVLWRIAQIKSEILAAETEPSRWFALYQRVKGPYWQDLSRLLVKLFEAGRAELDLESLERLEELIVQVDRHHLSVQRTISELVPWVPFFERVPDVLQDAAYSTGLSSLHASLPSNPSLDRIPQRVQAAAVNIRALRGLVSARAKEGETDREAMAWLDALDRSLEQATVKAGELTGQYAQIASRAEKIVSEMDFGFLYHPQRRVFHLGYNLDTGQLDHNFYDLLASEARITSILAISKGEAPLAHWMQLNRPITKAEGTRVLLSWSATMFEYLMPPLFLGSYPGTLLSDSAMGAVLHQIAYGKGKGLPWGISESGFYQFDNNQNYQYRAFGVPGLGFKRGLADDQVVAPYASLMALGYAPHAVMKNLDDLIGRGLFARYGFYESIDFTADRLSVGANSAVVREYMAHHQGMIMMAVDNYLHANVMARRMHSDPRIQSVELLLQEQVPLAVPVQNPFTQDVKGDGKLPAALEKIEPWKVPVHTPIPEVHLLSNGSYSVLISNMGGGYSRWRDVDLTRWQPDGALDPWGTWIYIQDKGQDVGESSLQNAFWSAAYQPVPGSAEEMQVTYLAHMAVFRRTERGITSTMEVAVTPDDPVEMRRVHLYNSSDYPRWLRLTSYGEVILTQQASDSRHPAFNKLFIESEFVPELDLQIFKRRLRSNQEKPFYLGHMLVTENPAAEVRHEADRSRFIGRGRTLRSPAALTSSEYLSGTSGATLDPIFSLGQEVELKPHGNAMLTFLTFAAESREAILALAGRFHSSPVVERSFHQADISSQAWLSQQTLNTLSFRADLQVLSALVYPFKAVRAPAETLRANRLGQAGLWRFGISGDYPILLVELDDPAQIELAREVLQVHKFLHSRQFLVDVVFLNQQATDYGAELRGKLFRLADQTGSEQWLNQRGGIFILHADQMNPEEAILLKTAARLDLRGERGALAEQLPGYSIQVQHLPPLVPTRPLEEVAALPESPFPPAGPLQFENGFGGFNADGREYVIDLPAGKTTPAPWVNIVGYPHFGFMVSESGSQCTWAINSGENRLTPWSNDSVGDPSGEALYLRDEETGEVWTPTPLPAGERWPYRVTHGAGYTIFESQSHGLSQRLTLFASPEDPVKIVHLRVKNTRPANRRITATQYVEWVLGLSHTASAAYIVPEYDPDHECMLAVNPYNNEFNERMAFLIASKPVHSHTADRTEFLGRAGTATFPAAMRRLGLEKRVTAGEDPCAVLQLHLDMLPGAVEEIYFVLGEASSRENALSLAVKYHDPAYVGAALERTHAFWSRLLGAIQVHTPDPAGDLILNHWLVYQTLSCRVWGRTAFYQSSGAFGFRDQLQDVLAVLAIDPGIARGQILNAAQRQFEEGDVLHWWHPPTGRGVRTRFSDDLLWLPYVAAQYVAATGDSRILAEKIPFLTAEPLKEGEEERYGEFPVTTKGYSLMEHCRRAIEKSITAGPHGLPLIGAGDWNDGMNRVGAEGRGESVWLAWFFCDVLNRFAGLCEQRKEHESARRYRDLARKYAAAVESSAWDGAWYRRAYYDDGAPLGSAASLECQIDAIAQSWAVMSGAGDPARGRQAMHSALERLVRPQDRLALLFSPPFNNTANDPGYIKGYAPGTRENGGQYTHAAVWTAWALACQGDGAQAAALFDLLNPLRQADAEAKAGVYRVEPYVMCADIYSQPPFVRRGGWTWYTGSSGWMYRLGLEAILGFRKLGDSLAIDPVIPPDWDGFEIVYRFGAAVYRVKVDNPQHAGRGVAEVMLDDRLLDDGSIPLVDDGKEHRVAVRMGVKEI